MELYFTQNQLVSQRRESWPVDTPLHDMEADYAMPALDAIVLSDLHLGSENSQTKPLAGLLSRILHGELPTHRLILNGDVFDSIDFRRLRKTHWKVLSLIRKLSDKIDVVWLGGNHDGSANIVSHLLGVRVLEQCVLVSGQRRIFIFHGHQHDRFIQDHPVLTWLADTVYAVLQKLDRRHYVARLAKRSSKVFLRCEQKIRHGAIASAQRYACDTVICGHTHHPIQDVSGEVAYYNCGCWTEKPCHYITIRDGQVILRQHEECPEVVSEHEVDGHLLLPAPAPDLATLLLPLPRGAFQQA